MSTRPIGPREAQLRAMREAARQPARPVTAAELKKAVGAAKKTPPRKSGKRRK